MFSVVTGNQLAQITQMIDIDQSETSRQVSGFASFLKNGLETGRISPQLRSRAIAMLFITVLNEAKKKASRHDHFNLETAINDLWTKLDGIRALDQRGDNRMLSGMSTATKGLTELLAQIVEKK